MKKYIVTVVKKVEEMRHIEIHADSKTEAEDKALLMQPRWLDMPANEEHSETYIDYIKEVQS